VVKYPLHSALLLVWLAGIVFTAVYDDVIYPVDNGLISIGLVLLFAVTLLTLIARVRRDEARRRGR
jgi:hypothetical protein